MPHVIRRFALVAAAGAALSGCSSDPAFWDAVAMGLDEAAYDLAQENAGCYWAPPPGAPLAANQRICPGDYAYRDIQLPASYYRDRYRDDRRSHQGGSGHRSGGDRRR